jgi:hypothetical protein
MEKLHCSNKELKKEIVYVVAFWDKENGWSSEVFSDITQAESQRGYGDFAGMTELECIVPNDA